MRIVSSTLLMMILAACATEVPPTQAAATPAKNCVRELRVGSTIPVVICSEPQTEAERQQMQSDIRNQLHSTPANGKGGG